MLAHVLWHTQCVCFSSAWQAGICCDTQRVSALLPLGERAYACADAAAHILWPGRSTSALTEGMCLCTCNSTYCVSSLFPLRGQAYAFFMQHNVTHTAAHIVCLLFFRLEDWHMLARIWQHTPS
jgi:hypothetical protein